MEIQKISFKQTATERVYNNYLKQVKKTLKILSKNEQQDILMEINSHIYEAMQQNSNEDEINCLLDVIDKLGDPGKVLKPLVAEKKLEQATKTFNPIHVISAIALNITNGISYIIFAIMYFFILCFIFLIVAKIFSPNVGLFFKNGRFAVLGFVTGSDNYTEVLGYWFIPVMSVVTIILYYITTLILKLKRLINKKVRL